MRTISTIQNPIFGKLCPDLPNLLGRWMSIEGLSIQILPSWFVTATRWKCGVADALFSNCKRQNKKDEQNRDLLQNEKRKCSHKSPNNYIKNKKGRKTG